MGDKRFAPYYSRVRDAEDSAREIREMRDEEIIAALAAASRSNDPYVANILATEALNRSRVNGAISRTIGEGVVAFDRDLRATFVNPAATAASGWSLATLSIAPLDETLFAPAGSPQGARANLLRVLAGDAWRSEDDVLATTTATFPAGYVVTPVSEDGDVLGGVAVFTDLTRRKEAERHLSLQLKVAQSLAGARSLPESATPVLRAVCEAFGWDAAILWHPKAEGPELEPIAEWSRDASEMIAFMQASKAARGSTDRGLLSFVWREARPLWVEEVSASRGLVRKESALEAGIRTAIFAPVVANGEVFGVMEFLTKSGEARDEGRMRTLATLGSQLGEFDDRMRADARDRSLLDSARTALAERDIALEALRRNNETLRTLVRSSPAGIVITTPEGAVDHWNPTAEGIFKLPSESLYGRPLRKGPLKALLDRALAGEAARDTIRETAADGRPIDLAVSAAPLVGAVDGVRGAVAVFIDISERIAVERELSDLRAVHEAFVQHVPAGVLYMNAEGRITFENGRLLDILGAGPGEAPLGWGRDLLDLETLAEHEPFRERVRELLRGVPFEGELLSYKSLYGRAVDLEVSGFPSFDEAGRLTGAMLLVQDLSSRISVETALARSESRYRNLVEMSPEPITVQHDGVVTYANPAAVALLGVASRDELVGRPLMDFVHPESRSLVARRMREIARTGRPLPLVEERFVRPDGKVLEVEVLAFPVVDEGGLAVQLLLRDISARKQAEAEVRRLNEGLERRVLARTRELAAANEELESFSYSVSHDLRAPLRGIDYATTVLEEEYSHALPAEGRELIRRAREESQRLTGLVGELHALSRVARGHVGRERVDLSRLAREVVESLRRGDPSRPVAVDIEPELGCEGDPRLLRIVLENLIGNAWKFTSRTMDPQISFARHGETDGMTTFVVRDNGAGFEPSKGDLLFTPFQRLHDSTDFEGTGIGLASVKRIVSRHGGHVRAEGRPGAGAAFYFTLPRSTLDGDSQTR